MTDQERTELRARKDALEAELAAVKAQISQDDYADVISILAGTTWVVDAETDDFGTIYGIWRLDWPERCPIPPLIWETLRRVDTIPLGVHGGMFLELTYWDNELQVRCTGQDGPQHSWLEAAASLGLKLDFEARTHKLCSEIEQLERRCKRFLATIERALSVLGEGNVLARADEPDVPENETSWAVLTRMCNGTRSDV